MNGYWFSARCLCGGELEPLGSELTPHESSALAFCTGCCARLRVSVRVEVVESLPVSDWRQQARDAAGSSIEDLIGVFA